MKTWEIKMKISVADSWIADGFNLGERIEDLEDQVRGLLPYSYGHEVKIKTTFLKSPAQADIEALQNGEKEIRD